jgi:O-methyltransferase domain
MANLRLYPFWGHLTEALRTGQPQNEIRTGGPSMFAALYADPARLRGFLQAMTGISRGANLAIAGKFPWKTYRTYVDVGTAQGDLAVQVALAHPHLTGTGFDLAEVGPIFEDYVEHNRLAGRLAFKAGSFHRSDSVSGRRDDGPHPARLGFEREADARAECVRTDDEPQHADRNARRIRLHRRGLHGLDEARRLFQRAR